MSKKQNKKTGKVQKKGYRPVLQGEVVLLPLPVFQAVVDTVGSLPWARSHRLMEALIKAAKESGHEIK